MRATAFAVAVAAAVGDADSVEAGDGDGISLGDGVGVEDSCASVVSVKSVATSADPNAFVMSSGVETSLEFLRKARPNNS